MNYEIMNNKKESLIASKSFKFVIEIIRITKFLPNTYEHVVIIKQIIRSVTSIGANIEEALASNTRKEFIHSMNIAKKEARETLYWLKLLAAINPQKNIDFFSLMKENQEIITVLTSIVKTSTERA